MRIPLNKVIIIEGPDCSGKTTLARHLCQTLPRAVYLHAVGTKSLVAQDTIVDYFGQLVEIANVNMSLGRYVVMDRHWPSELVYGPVLQRKLFNPDMFIQALQRLNAEYVCCHPGDMDAAIKRQKAHAAHEYPDDLFKGIIERYYSFAFPYMEASGVVHHYRHFETKLPTITEELL